MTENLSSMPDDIVLQLAELSTKLSEQDELLSALLKGDQPEILIGRVGPGDGILSYGIVDGSGILRFKACSPRAAALLAKYLEVPL